MLATRDQEVVDLRNQLKVGHKRGYETDSNEFIKSKIAKSDRDAPINGNEDQWSLEDD